MSLFLSIEYSQASQQLGQDLILRCDDLSTCFGLNDAGQLNDQEFNTELFSVQRFSGTFYLVPHCDSLSLAGSSLERSTPLAANKPLHIRHQQFTLRSYQTSLLSESLWRQDSIDKDSLARFELSYSLGGLKRSIYLIESREILVGYSPHSDLPIPIESIPDTALRVFAGSRGVNIEGQGCCVGFKGQQRSQIVLNHCAEFTLLPGGIKLELKKIAPLKYSTTI